MARRLTEDAVKNHAARKLIEALRPLMERPESAAWLSTELRDAYALLVRVFMERPTGKEVV